MTPDEKLPSAVGVPQAGRVPGGDPPWAWPAFFVGRVHPGLSEETRRDIRMFAAVPAARVGLPAGSAGWLGAGLAIVLPLIFTLFRVGVTDVFTESLLFLVLAMALGYLSPALGVLTVLCHGVFDLLVVLPGLRAAYDLPFGGPWWPLAGRLISFWLLWLLVVEVPLLTRSIRDHGLDLERRVPAELRLVGTLVVAVIVGGALVFVWTQGVPLLIRPVFVWSTFGSPTLPAIQPIQESGTVLVIVGGICAVLAVLLRTATLGGRSDVDEAVDARAADRAGSTLAGNRGLAIAGRLVSYGLIILGVGGLVSGLFDVVLLAATLLATPYIAAFITSKVPYRRPLARIPVVVRFLIGFAVTYVIGLVITGITFDSALGSEFFPIVLVIAAGLVVFEILLGDVEDSDARPPATPHGSDGSAAMATRATPPVGTAAFIALIGGLSFLALPGPVLADNCSSLSDCYGTAGATAAAAAAAAGVAGIVTITRLAAGLGRRGRTGGGGSRGPADEQARAAGAPPDRIDASSGMLAGSVPGPTSVTPASGALPPQPGGSLVGSFQQADLADFVGPGRAAPGEDEGITDDLGSTGGTSQSGASAHPAAAGAAPGDVRARPQGAVPEPSSGIADDGTPGAVGDRTMSEAGQPGGGAGADLAIQPDSIAGVSGGVGAFLQADLADFTASGGAEQGNLPDEPDEEPAGGSTADANPPDARGPAES